MTELQVGPIDYLAIARHYHTVILVGIPRSNVQQLADDDIRSARGLPEQLVSQFHQPVRPTIQRKRRSQQFDRLGNALRRCFGRVGAQRQQRGGTLIE